MCFSETYCKEKCDFGYMLDPREYCTCISEEEALKLWYESGEEQYEMEEGEDDKSVQEEPERTYSTNFETYS